MKKLTALALALALCLIAALPASASVTSALTPAEEPALLFTKKLGTGYRNAPTPLAAAEGAVFVTAGQNLYKLDAHTGETLASVRLESISTYTAVPPLVAAGAVYMPLDDGIVQAFSQKDLTWQWTYTDPLGGQSLTPVVYEDGYLYTGFWNGEADEANYVCLPAKGSGEQKAVWTFTSDGGFYRTGALLRGDYLIVGSENGERVNLPDAPSHIYSLNKRTGALVSALTAVGDLRAGIGFDESSGFCYTVSKSGILYRFSADPVTGVLSGLKEAALPGSSTVTPIPYKGRLYVACGGGRKGHFLVMDPATLETVYDAELPGVPQGDMCLSTGWEESTGKVLLYMTYNAPPGGLYRFEDGPGQTEAAGGELFAPPEDMAQYCFCPVTAGEDGSLYYKNDSGNIFALAGAGEKREGLAALRELLRRFSRLFSVLLTLLRGRFGL